MTSTFPENIAAFQKNFISPDPAENFVYSTLGVWTLISFLANMNKNHLTAEETVNVEKFLGCSIDEATQRTEALFTKDNEDVDIEAKGWFDADFKDFSTKIAQMMEGSTASSMKVEGATPTQEQLDNWVSKATHGLIEQFPVEVSPDLLALLATIVSTKIEWVHPYEETTVGAENWNVPTVLKRDDEDTTGGFIDTKEGIIGYTKNRSQHGLEVYSFISEKDMTLEELDALATDFLTRPTAVAEDEVYRELSVKEIADSGAFWSVKQTEIVGSADVIKWSVTVPAWEADTSLDLLEKDYGFMSAAAEIIREGIRFNGPDGVDLTVTQKCVAKYGKNGFEAAAVTAFAMFRASGILPRPGKKIQYDVELNFNKPHVVIALATDYKDYRNSPWHKVPVFNAHIRKAVAV